jgi:hypothetical protein
MSKLAAIGQIWCDDCYYLSKSTGQCQRKYLLVLAVDKNSGDVVTVVFTSKPNGLPDNPACYIGNPRSGYYLGIPGGVFFKETWLDFISLETLDGYDLTLHANTGRKTLLQQTLPAKQFCQALRCIMQMQEDITKQQWRLLGDTVANLNCPY